MELEKVALALLFCIIFISFGESKPFGSGYSMLSSKSVILSNDISGRDPVISSAFLDEASFLSFNMFYVSYFNKNDIEEYRDDRAMFGVSFSKNRIAAKLAYEKFNFMSIYSENEINSSLAVKLNEKLKIALNSEYTRKSILIGDYEKVNFLKFSLTSVYKIKMLMIALDISSVPFNCSRNNFDFNLSYIDVIISTNSSGYVNQGVRISLSPLSIEESRLFWALSMKTYGPIYLNFNISTNPVFLGCGLTFKFNRNGIYFGASVHPVLGVSTGVGLEQLILRR